MSLLTKYLKLWNLTLDGDPIYTQTSELFPVLQKGKKCMLKIAFSEEERQGNRLMVWWNGVGAAFIFEHDDYALLMERAIAGRSLAGESDDSASLIICQIANKLHTKRDNLPSLLSLNEWFKSLEKAALKEAGIFNLAWKTANELLISPEEQVVLHGDLHHNNILHFGNRGWLAIDPKHIQGERGYDFANLFCNPDKKVALRPGRFQKQLEIVRNSAQLDKKRLLQWILAYSGLSASWHLEDGSSAELALAIADMALQELSKSQ